MDNYIHFVLQSGMKFDLVRSESTLLHVSPFNSLKKRGGIALRRVFFPFSSVGNVLYINSKTI